VEPPQGIEAKVLINHVRDKYNLLISGSFDYLENKVIRIGHMGENATMDKIIFVLNIIDKSLKDLGYKSETNLVEEFNRYIML